MSEPAEAQPTQSYRDQVREAIGAIQYEVSQEILGAGEIAALRRAATDGRGNPAVWRLAVRHLEGRGLLEARDPKRREQLETAWAALVPPMVDMMSRGLHDPRSYFGQALAKGEVSEARVLRLLRASGQALFDQVRTTAHLLTNRGQPVSWVEIVLLVTSDGHPDHAIATRPRRKVARDYYATLEQQRRGSSEATAATA